MSYLRIDDNFADHPKIVGLSDAAFRLHLAGLCYSARHLTDGIVPASTVPRLVRRYRKSSLFELTERALWVPLASEKWFQIHDYLDWNMSRETVQRRREIGRQAAQKRWDDKGGWIG